MVTKTRALAPMAKPGVQQWRLVAALAALSLASAPALHAATPQTHHPANWPAHPVMIYAATTIIKAIVKDCPAADASPDAFNAIPGASPNPACKGKFVELYLQAGKQQKVIVEYVTDPAAPRDMRAWSAGAAGAPKSVAIYTFPGGACGKAPQAVEAYSGRNDAQVRRYCAAAGKELVDADSIKRLARIRGVFIFDQAAHRADGLYVAAALFPAALRGSFGGVNGFVVKEPPFAITLQSGWQRHDLVRVEPADRTHPCPTASPYVLTDLNRETLPICVNVARLQGMDSSTR